MSIMNIADINYRCSDALEDAASQWVINGEPHPMLDLINQVMRDSFLDGYNHAIEVLKETFNETTKKERVL